VITKTGTDYEDWS